MIGESPGFAARRWNHEDVRVAVIIRREADPFAIRREIRVALRANARGEPLGIAAFAAYRPDIAGIAKGDLVAADRGMPDQQRLGSIRAADGSECEATKVKLQRRV